MVDPTCDFLDHFYTIVDILGELLDCGHIFVDMVSNLQCSRRRHQSLFPCEHV
jgi:hypothetical protein